MIPRAACLVLILGATWAGVLRSGAPPGLPTAQIIGQRAGFTGAYPRAVLADSQGRLWVASDIGGLYLGDGLRFLKVDLPGPLQGRSDSDVAEDRHGRIWLLSTGGLGTWDRGAWQVDETIKDRELTLRRRSEGIFSQPGGDLLVVASGRAWRIPEGGRPAPIPLPGTDADGDPSLTWQGSQLIANRGGRFWRETAKGWTDLPSLPMGGMEHPQGPLRCDGDGHLYLLTEHHLYHLAPGASAWRPLELALQVDGTRMTRLQDGRIWILQNQQALRILGGVITSLAMPRGFSSYGAEARCLDAEGNLWITRTDLVRIPALGLVLSHVGEGFPPPREVWSVHRDPNGPLWITSEAGVFRQNAEGWREVKGIPVANGLSAGPDGWLYTRSRRHLMRVDPRTLRSETVRIPLRKEGVEIRRGPVIHGRRLWALDPDGQLVAGTWKDGHWDWAWESSPPVPSGSSAFFLGDELGRPWLTFGHRTFCRVAERWEEVPMPDGIQPVDLSFSSAEEGLAAQFAPPAVVALARTATGWKSRRIVSPSELRNIGTLYAIRKDGRGNIWINSDRGVVRLEPGDPPRLHRYGSDLGLPADDTDQAALLPEGTERIWVGTILGLAEIRPGEGSGIPPLTVPSLLEARCGDWVRQAAEPFMSIRHGQGSVVWELGFPGPVRGEGAHFEFREAGGSWATLAGTALQFPTISPGRHTYEVRVVPMLGQPGPIRRLEIRVLPPWYRHPAAYTLWALLLVGTVHLLIRWRLSRLERRNRELSLAVAQATEGLRARERDLELVNRRLYELNDAKNRIIGLAAHDLRNPLSGILLHGELLQEDLQHPEAAKSLGAIRTLGTTMMDLIQRLLDVHAIEVGHAEAPRIDAMDLAAALAGTLERARTAAERKHISLSSGPAPTAWVMGDPAQVAQILDNFLGNAVKFSPAETTITLGLEDAGPCWRAYVKDQGPGLSAEDLSRAFGEYARLSAQPTAGEPSVGLGLSLVKRMAEAMGGVVGVDSVQGHGATFWLDLPKV
ncbi:hypothetical protein GETHLI_06380 [Geothrix limicola]|uniref:histidine kinase n=1 Tax=Geothrix limicola TaxID=2927978 RepID=A0ABQ5QCF1_9BACT|nr:ATP-binding protein [Geothrix limicola]GLH72136.1 hypothetical protein GETHLI_06380 [Geothrix limicola]